MPAAPRSSPQPSRPPDKPALVTSRPGPYLSGKEFSMNIDPTVSSIVAVRAHIPDDAFTASGLGTLREGSGVVIRESGLVLTIGYLITEATEVWLTTQDGRVVPGHALAIDSESGFGLVQALGKLDLPALKFADSATAKPGDP